MTKTTVSNELIAGLQDAVAYAEGKAHGGKAYQVEPPVIVVEPAAIRAGLGLTQQDFASRYGIPVATLRNWEQRHRAPEGPARVLLAVIEQYPDEVAAVVLQQRQRTINGD